MSIPKMHTKDIISGMRYRPELFFSFIKFDVQDSLNETSYTRSSNLILSYFSQLIMICLYVKFSRQKGI